MRPNRTEALKQGLCQNCRIRKRWINPSGVQITRCSVCRESAYGNRSKRYLDKLARKKPKARADRGESRLQ
jgi:NMD protein affecting ribosome stability and mRNA decay